MENFDEIFWLYSRCIYCNDVDYHQVILNTKGKIIVGCMNCWKPYNWKEVEIKKEKCIAKQ